MVQLFTARACLYAACFAGSLGELRPQEDDPHTTFLLQQALNLRPPSSQQSSSAAEMRTRSVPRAEINLDLPPEERWREFYAAHREHLLPRNKSPTPPHVEDGFIQKSMSFDGYEELVAELRGILEVMNTSSINLDLLLEGEFGYDEGATAFCTSMLAADSQGTVFHGRNLDLTGGSDKFDDFFDVTYYRGGQPLIVSTQFWFNVGTFTGYRFGSYSLSQNTRPGCGEIDKNIEAAKRGAKPAGWLMRQTLQDVASFSDAVHTLASVPVMTPQYFILAGAGPWEGALITRDRLGNEAPYANVEVLSPQIDRWYIVETNDDTWKRSIDPRRPVALEKLSEMTKDMVNGTFVLDMMMTEPVLSNFTMFTWVVEPSTGERHMYLGFDELNGDVISAFKSPTAAYGQPHLATGARR